MKYEELMKLGEQYVSIGIADWATKFDKKEMTAEVFINKLELKAFCIPDKDETEMLKEIGRRIFGYFSKREADIGQPTKGSFVRAGTVIFHELPRKRGQNPFEKTKDIAFYIKVPRINKNGLAPCEEKIAKQLADMVIRKHAEEIAQQLRDEFNKNNAKCVDTE